MHKQTNNIFRGGWINSKLYGAENLPEIDFSVSSFAIPRVQKFSDDFSSGEYHQEVDNISLSLSLFVEQVFVLYWFSFHRHTIDFSFKTSFHLSGIINDSFFI